jgi:cell division GTPase FtsZ
VSAVAQSINGVVSEDANIIFGASVDDEMGDELCVTVVATDFPPGSQDPDFISAEG